MNIESFRSKSSKNINCRMAYRAGTFYPGNNAQCQNELQHCIPDTVEERAGNSIIAAVVPHAGWMYSGPTAGKVYRALQQNSNPSTIVIFGAVHVYGVDYCAVWTKGVWQTPLGEIAVDEELANKILAQKLSFIHANHDAHLYEHSIEVQIPFIQKLFPQAKILPIMVEPCAEAVQLGECVAKVADESVVAIASSDMTHYGERFDFTPAGMGEKALEWVKQHNDRQLIDYMIQMEAEKIVPEARQHHNACGSGAIAAVVAFARSRQRTKGQLLAYTTSWDVQPEHTMDSFVGYSGLVF